MSIRINPSMPAANVMAYERASKIHSETGAPKMGRDQLQISNSAQSFAQVYKAAQKAIGTVSAEHEAKVSGVAERIRNGTYHVSSGDVASSIIDDLI